MERFFLQSDPTNKRLWNVFLRNGRYEVNGKLVTGNGSLIPICSLSNSSLLPSLTVHNHFQQLKMKKKSKELRQINFVTCT